MHISKYLRSDFAKGRQHDEGESKREEYIKITFFTNSTINP